MARNSRYTRAGRKAASRGADAAAKLPVNSVAPAITGVEASGNVLTCSSGTWTNTPSYSYQWNRSGDALIGETAATHTLVAGDVGETMTCTVTATNERVQAAETSAATGVIA